MSEFKFGKFGEYVFSGDFETTNNDGEDFSEVWASGLAQLFIDNNEDDVKVHTSIEDAFEFLEKLCHNTLIFYHNLAFDGMFILNYLFNNGYKYEVAEKINKKDGSSYYDFESDAKMKRKSFKYMISGRGEFYRITIKTKDAKVIEFRDSLKLLPCTLSELGKGFNTKHQKLEYNGYKKYHRAGAKRLSTVDKKYLVNDVLVLKEALEIFLSEGNTELTIGACCMREYKAQLGGNKIFRMIFPDLYKESPECYTFVRNTYFGGWCYIKDGEEGNLKGRGYTVDCNSLYPYSMISESGNKYPFGYPTHWKGSKIPDMALDDNHYYFLHVKVKLELKKDHLPFLRVPGNFMYSQTKYLTTSVVEKNGYKFDEPVDLWLTKTDFELMKEQYDIRSLRVLEGYYFSARTGLFDEYLYKYRDIKMKSTGAPRLIAKLFSNNLGGKFGSSPDAELKLAEMDNDGVINFSFVDGKDRVTGYVPVASAMTAYGRAWTIRAAQANYENFIYSDTDSLHCVGRPEEVKGIKLHDTEYGAWKIESVWDTGKFLGKKVYAEHDVKEGWILRAAGLTKSCAKEFAEKMNSGKMNIRKFDYGMKIEGALKAKRVKGGVILEEVVYSVDKVL